MTKYLLQIDDELHGYDRLDVLKCDMAMNKPDDYKLFRRVDGLMKVKYVQLASVKAAELVENE